MNVIDKLTAFMRGLTSDKTVSVVAKPMNCFLKVKMQLRSALSYWQKLIDIDLEKEADNAVDYDELRIW